MGKPHCHKQLQNVFQEKSPHCGGGVGKIIDDTPDSELIPDDYADSEEKRRIIMNIIDTALTDEQRQTIILFYFDMMSVAEIAEIMECSVGTVTSRLSAARKKIREAVLIYEKKTMTGFMLLCLYLFCQRYLCRNVSI